MAKKKASQSKQLVVQGAKFGVVGVSNTVIDYVVYSLVRVIFHVPLPNLYLVKYFSGSVAMVNSFYWNRRWVFPSRASLGRSGLRFLVATLVSVYAIQPGLVRLFSGTASGQAFGRFWFNLAHSLGIAGPLHLSSGFVISTVAFGMGVIGSAIWDFTLYKVWAFRD